MWYRLDNTGTVFSLISAKRVTWLFRISATLKDPVNVSMLQEALEKTLPRFPCFRVHLRAGLFWHFWDTVRGLPRIIADSQYPCEPMKLGRRGILPFRVRAAQNRVAVEFHHALTDGAGALAFFKTLLCEYCILKGARIDDWGDVLRITDRPDPGESEDAYKTNYLHSIPKPEKFSKAYQIPYKVLKGNMQYITTGSIHLPNLLKITRERSVSLTEYLVAVYLDALQDILFSLEKKPVRPLRIMVPVNARNIYGSHTLRNFFFSVMPGIDVRLGRYSFDDILKEVHHFMRVEVNARYINQQLKRNIASEIHPLIRITPLFLKKFIMGIAFRGLGEYHHSGVFSNLGAVTLPEAVLEQVLDFQFLPAATPVIKTICGVVSFKENINISFLRIVNESDVEMVFFRKLIKAGVPVKISTHM